MTTANPAAQPSSSEPGRLQRVLLRQESILFIILVAGVLLLSMQSDVFLTPENLLNQSRLAGEVALIALPMTLIIITGGIDLSVGSIMGLASIMLGVAWYNWGLPLELAIVVALLIGTACGLFNGLFITRVGLPPLITTLATLALFRGLAEGIAQARSVRGYPEWFYILGQKNFLGDLTSIPNQLLIVVLAVIAIGAALAWTPFGRSLYAIGNNETGARFSGLPVQRNKLIIYTLSGLHVRRGGLGLRLAREHHPLGLRQRHRAHGHHRRGRRWHQHLRRQRHDPGHRAGPGAHPAHEERLGAVRRQG